MARPVRPGGLPWRTHAGAARGSTDRVGYLYEFGNGQAGGI